MGIPNNNIHTENGNVNAIVIKTKFLQAQHQINTGIKNGTLTEEEAAALKSQMEDTFQDLTAFKGEDGKVDQSERLYTRQELNELLKGIKTAKQA